MSASCAIYARPKVFLSSDALLVHIFSAKNRPVFSARIQKDLAKVKAGEEFSVRLGLKAARATSYELKAPKESETMCNSFP